MGDLLPGPMPGAGPTVVRAAVRTSRRSYVSAVKPIAAGEVTAKVTAKVPAGTPRPRTTANARAPALPCGRAGALYSGAAGEAVAQIRNYCLVIGPRTGSFSYAVWTLSLVTMTGSSR